MTENTDNTMPQCSEGVEEPTFVGYPPGCPLCEAVPAEGVAFRITRHDPPLPEDFQSNFEKGEEPRPKSSKRLHCRWRALSIYRTIEDARQHIKKWPYVPSYIAAGHLTKKKGKTLLTPPNSPETERQSHTEWWCADGIDRTEGFNVIE